MRIVGSFVVIATICIASVIPTSYCVPFVIIPGLFDKCGEKSSQWLTRGLSNVTGSTGHCIDIKGGGYKTFYIPLLKQTEMVCEIVKRMDSLKDGYNIVGFSQGALVARGVIEFCDGGPRVKNFISLGGPHAGIQTVRPAGLFGFLWRFGKWIIYKGFIQNHLAPSGYIKIPTRIDEYIRGCKFLPKLNNEIPGRRNSAYKERFSSLENLVLVMYEEDKMVIPKESSWFGYYPDGASSPVLSPNETKLYIEDWIGLRALDEKGRVQFVKSAGVHLNITGHLLRNYIIPYLRNERVKNE